MVSAVRFDGEELFGSGPCEVEAGGLELRRAEHEAPGSDGVRMIGQGRGARTITQTGELAADSPEQMRELTNRIESRLDGLAHELVDDRGQVWERMVMLAFEPGAMKRVGTRFVVSYRVEYAGD